MAQRHGGDDAAGTAVVIEDDPDIRELISSVLQQSGFQVHTSADGAAGVAAVELHHADLVTVDLGLPGIDGFEVVRQIRLHSDCYIVMVSARTDEVDTLMALNTGADDFITKPFRPRELRARVTAMFRRPRAAHVPDVGDPAGDGAGGALRGGQVLGALSDPGSPGAPDASAGSAGSARPAASPAGSPILSHDNLRLDPDARTVSIGDDDIVLTRTEFELLHTLLLSGRRVRTKADLVRHLRAGDSAGSAAYVSEADERAVEVHIGNLRRKLSRGDQAAPPAAVIETVRGVGYKLAPTST
ncbi:response regulator transcription factor [Corynebacterium sp.]|uniref:response regulator transcription factor n=1 Tax=Corynebacterium sp. TaxID=1720 RepID=UPI003B3A5056